LHYFFHPTLFFVFVFHSVFFSSLHAFFFFCICSSFFLDFAYKLCFLGYVLYGTFSIESHLSFILLSRLIYSVLSDLNKF
jgi:hypothetical protein